MNQLVLCAITIAIGCGGKPAQKPTNTPDATPHLALADATLSGTWPGGSEDLVVQKDGSINSRGAAQGTVLPTGELRDAKGVAYIWLAANGKVTVADDTSNHFHYTIGEDGTVIGDGNVNLAFGADGTMSGADLTVATNLPPQAWKYNGPPEARRAIALAWIAKRMGFRNPFRTK